jgi:hypothetical protein
MFEKCLQLLSMAAVPLLLFAVLGVAVCLFLMLKVELRLLGRHAVTRAELENAVRMWTGELEEVRVRLQEVEHECPSPAEWSAAGTESSNLNRRAQILGLHRKGKPVREIASVLHIPQGEVELMVKVHDLSRSARLEIKPVSLL